MLKTLLELLVVGTSLVMVVLAMLAFSQLSTGQYFLAVVSLLSVMGCYRIGELIDNQLTKISVPSKQALSH